MTVTIDVSGLRCPMPVLQAKQQLRQLAPGEQLTVIATDPMSIKDFAIFAEQTGNKLVEQWQVDDQYYFLLEKKE